MAHLGAVSGFVAGSVASNGSSPVLVLWDIDHTLIAAQGMGQLVYQRAFLAATGRSLRAAASFAGRTELAIMRETLLRHEIDPTDTAIGELAARVVAEFERARAEMAGRGRVLPGALATLAALAGEDSVHQGVLTGNLRAVARIKLEVFGLDAHLDMAAGAYGEDHVDRARLVGYAQARAARHFDARFDDARTVLIGDTRNDVRAALDAGVHVIGVATGEDAADELRRAGAATVLTRLEPAAIRRRIRELARTPSS